MENPAQFPTEFHSEVFGPVRVRDVDGSDCYSPVQGFRHGDSEFTLKAGDGKSSAAREDLLASMAAGKNVELEVDFRAFQQLDDEPNANHIRFKKSILRKFAKSFSGVPLLRDHDQDNVLARAGTINKSQAVNIDGGVAFDMTAAVTAPWAVDALLRGNIDRFSIGFAHGGRQTILCSLCNTPVFTSCVHRPGDVVEAKDGSEQRVEFVFTEAVGVETSGVSVPAAAGTGISGVRSALSSYAAEAASRKDPAMKDIAQALGLPADATSETILAALSARKEAQIVASATHAEQTTRVAELEAENLTLSASQRAAEVDVLFTKFADRLPVTRDPDDPKKRIPSTLEVELRTLAASSIDSARAILAAQPKAVPVGPATTEVVNPVHSADPSMPSDIPWSPELASQLKQLKMTKEDYIKFGPHAEQPSLIPEMPLTYAGSKIH